MPKVIIQDIQDAIFRYRRYFDLPADVVSDTTLSRSDKVKLLKNWEYDAQLENIAEEESMPGHAPNRLDEIESALSALENR